MLLCTFTDGRSKPIWMSPHHIIRRLRLRLCLCLCRPNNRFCVSLMADRGGAAWLIAKVGVYRYQQDPSSSPRDGHAGWEHSVCCSGLSRSGKSDRRLCMLGRARSAILSHCVYAVPPSSPKLNWQTTCCRGLHSVRLRMWLASGAAETFLTPTFLTRTVLLLERRQPEMIVA